MPTRRPLQGPEDEGGWAIASAWGILGASRPLVVPPLSEAALQALFAPYCGGLAREADLLAALRTLKSLGFDGLRPVDGGLDHRYLLRWSAVHAPLESTSCQMRFPDRTELVYEFDLVTHQLVQWLMDCRLAEDGQLDLPDSFWQWLLLGADPSDQA